jgi:hypothetical protein
MIFASIRSRSAISSRKHIAMMVHDAALQNRTQLIALGAQGSAGFVGHPVGMFLAGDDRLNDATAGHPRMSLATDPSFTLASSRIFAMRLWTRLRSPRQFRPIARQIPQILYRSWGHETGPQQPVGQPIADPLAVFLVCLVLEGHFPLLLANPYHMRNIP